VERWADEHAASVTGDRPLAARAIAHAALASSAAPPATSPVAALTLIPRDLRGAGPVPRRVAALLSPPPRSSLLLLGAAVALVAVSGLSALEAARNLHQLIEYAQAASGS
jgi:hypothetical protein